MQGSLRLPRIALLTVAKILEWNSALGKSVCVSVTHMEECDSVLEQSLKFNTTVFAPYVKTLKRFEVRS